MAKKKALIKTVKCVSLTPGVDQHGLFGHLFVTKGGDQYRASAKPWAKRNVGDVLKLRVVSPGNYDWEAFGLEHVEKLKYRASGDVLEALWAIPERGPQETVVEPPSSVTKKAKR